MACSHRLLVPSEYSRKSPSWKFQCYHLYFAWMLGRVSTLTNHMENSMVGLAPCSVLCSSLWSMSVQLLYPDQSYKTSVSTQTASAIPLGKSLAFWLRICRGCVTKNTNRNMPLIFLLMLEVRWRTYYQRTGC